MGKKRATLIVVGVEILIYLGIFVGIPALYRTLICSTCNSRELFTLPLRIMSPTPGLIGLILILLIWWQGKEDSN